MYNENLFNHKLEEDKKSLSLKSNFSERTKFLQNKTQILMDQINKLEAEMKNQSISTKIDVKNLKDTHYKNINKEQMKYENEINENINKHAIQEKKLLQMLDDK
jgi:hypothetical protein